MKRFEDWPERLAAFLESRQGARFDFGQNDCAMFVCDAILAMTGEDPGAPLRGYASEMEAIRKELAFIGKVDPQITRIPRMVAEADELLLQVATEIARQNEMPEVARAFARRGDAVYLLVPELGGALGLMAVDGQPICACREGGYRSVPLECVLRAWRV